MKQIADYKFTLNYEGKEYSFKDKIKMDIFGKSGLIAIHIKDNPFKKILAGKIPDILFLASKGYGSYHFYEINEDTTYWEESRNNFIFHMMKNLNDLCDIKNRVLFSLTSHNCRNMNSYGFDIKNLEKWVDDMNNQLVNIYKKDDEVNISKCGYVKMDIKLNKSKIYGMLI